MPERATSDSTSTERRIAESSASAHPARAAALQALVDLLGLPYLWGGKDPSGGGMDCSGAVNYARWKAGLAPKSDGARLAADDLYRKLARVAGRDTEVGDLVFYGTKERVTHVMMLAGGGRCIGEVGGGRSCTTVAEAKRIGARMDWRPVMYRRDIVGYGRLV